MIGLCDCEAAKKCMHLSFTGARVDNLMPYNMMNVKV